ncbi:MAG: branched-chain amino acid ABC transporter permease [Rhodospirillaceae bacterium]|nr:branched-chain amino acid ABC transporter permease [Rhodospirillaceae bacterium]
MSASKRRILAAGRWLPGLGFAAFIAVSTAILTPFHLNQLALVGSYCVALIGLNIVVGLAGQLSLAHGAFFAIGAYATAILVVKTGMPFPLALIGAGVMTMVIGFFAGFPALRLKSHYLAVATLAFSVAVPPIANRWSALTGGSSGLDMGQIAVPAWLPLGRDQYLFVLAAIVVAAAMAMARRVAASPFGAALSAIRENDVAAVAMGVNLAWCKLSAFAVSALLAGIGGGIFAQAVGFVAPENFSVVLSFLFLAGVVIGGPGAFYGSILGALFLRFIPDYAADIDRYLAGVLFGLAIVLTLRFMPHGPHVALRTVLRRFTARRRQAGAAGHGA